MHPTHGARFICDRQTLEPLAYDVAVFLAGGTSVHASLSWGEAGVVLQPAPQEPWIYNEIVKLARVLRHTKQDRLTRWRGP